MSEQFPSGESVLTREELVADIIFISTNILDRDPATTAGWRLKVDPPGTYRGTSISTPLADCELMHISGPSSDNPPQAISLFLTPRGHIVGSPQTVFWTDGGVSQVTWRTAGDNRQDLPEASHEELQTLHSQVRAVENFRTQQLFS